MSLIFSKQCEYALRAVLYLALQPDGDMTPIKDLSKRLDLPSPFLAKILQDLATKGLLKSLKGPTGGFALAMASSDITLLHIVEAIDGLEFMHKCVMGFPECGGENPCPVHERWGTLREDIYAMLVSKNVGEMASDMKKPGYRS